MLAGAHMQNVDPVGLVAAGASPSQGHQSRHPSLGLWTREVYMDKKKGRCPRLVSCKGQVGGGGGGGGGGGHCQSDQQT